MWSNDLACPHICTAKHNPSLIAKIMYLIKLKDVRVLHIILAKTLYSSSHVQWQSWSLTTVSDQHQAKIHCLPWKLLNNTGCFHNKSIFFERETLMNILPSWNSSQRNSLGQSVLNLWSFYGWADEEHRSLGITHAVYWKKAWVQQHIYISPWQSQPYSILFCQG